MGTQLNRGFKEMSSLYAQYIFERENMNIVENDNGFATYTFLNNGEIYLKDLFVKSMMRKTGLGVELADEVCRIGKEHGCKKLIGSVWVNANNPEESIGALLFYKMRITKAHDNMIWFEKDLD